MGTLLNQKFVRLRRKWPPHQHLPLFTFMVLIGMQAQIINCSGGLNLQRPYLFRDFLPQAFTNSAPHAQIANLYQKSSGSPPSPPPPTSQYADSEEVGSSEEEPLYTAPLILDIDDPEVKARWMGFSGQESFEEQEQDDRDEDYEEGSISSSEFSSRSSAQIGRSENSGENKNNNKNDDQKSTSNNSNGPSDESRGMLDNFGISNPLSGFWGGDDTEAQSAEMVEMPHSDETPEYYYESYAYDNNPAAYYYDPNEELNDQKKPPAGWPKPKQKPKPVIKPNLKPIVKPAKVKVKKPSLPKSKPKPLKVKLPKSPKPSKSKPPKRKIKKRKKKRPSGPPPMPHYHYQELDKLSIITEKLSKLNPFRYVQFQAPQIKITKTYDEPPHGPPHGPPPRRKKRKPMKGKKPKKPKPPPKLKLKQKPKPPKPKLPPKPKPSKPKKKVMKRPGWSPSDETAPEFEFYFGNPFGGYNDYESSGKEPQYDYRHDAEEDEDEAEDDDDDNDNNDEDTNDNDDEDEDEDDDYSSGESTGQSVAQGYQDQTSTEEGAEAETDAEAGDDGNTEAGEDGNAETEGEDGETVLIEDDEADYGTGGMPGLSSPHLPTSSTPEEKEKSLSFQKIIGWRKKKKPKPKKHKHKPARRPPNWKQYRPAPLLPEIPEGVHDAVLKVIKNVGFLPEYGKNEKYGGHNKIKGKFTKTRPITLHHGLLTEVLRRK